MPDAGQGHKRLAREREKKNEPITFRVAQLKLVVKQYPSTDNLLSTLIHPKKKKRPTPQH